MLRHLKRKRGFTLVEIVIAAIIFSLVSIGLYATISALSGPAELSTKETTAAFLGKEALERLRLAVNAEVWDDSSPATNPLAPGPHATSVPVDGVTYTIQYDVSDDASAGGRFVNLNVTW